MFLGLDLLLWGVIGFVIGLAVKFAIERSKEQ